MVLTSKTGLKIESRGFEMYGHLSREKLEALL